MGWTTCVTPVTHLLFWTRGDGQRCLCVHEYLSKLLQKHQTDIAFYCKIPPGADNLYTKLQLGMAFNVHIYKPLNTKISPGDTDTAQTLAELVSSALVTTVLYKSRLSASHHSRPHWEPWTSQCVGMIESAAHTWAPVVSVAVIINVRKPEWWKAAQVPVKFIAFRADVPQPWPAVTHLELECQNILQIIFLVPCGTNDRESNR